MEILTNNPGLQHIAEEIFLNLGFFCLEKVEKVHESWKMIVNNPSFLLQKCIQNTAIHVKNQKPWKAAIQVTKHTDYEKNIILHLKSIFRESVQC